MGIPIITERRLDIDDKVGSLTNFTSMLVGGFDALAGKVMPTQDLTNATNANPDKVRTGFTEFKSFKLQFRVNIGGSPDVADQLWKNMHLPAGTTRTVKGTFNTTGLTWSFTIEANIISVQPIQDPADKAITLLEVEFECTGASTEVFA